MTGQRKGSVGDGLFILWLVILAGYAFTHGHTAEFLVVSGTMILVDQVLRWAGRRKRTEK